MLITTSASLSSLGKEDVSLGNELFKGGIAKLIKSFISKVFKGGIYELGKGFITNLVKEFSKVACSVRSKGANKGSARACTSLVRAGVGQGHWCPRRVPSLWPLVFREPHQAIRDVRREAHLTSVFFISFFLGAR